MKFNKFPYKVIEGVKFRDGVEVEVNNKTNDSRNAA